MKLKAVISAAIIAGFLSGQTPPPVVRLADVYPVSTVVTEVDEELNLVTVETFTGIKYQFYGTDDWIPGDVAALLMDTNGTDTVIDDSIIAARYSGWLY